MKASKLATGSALLAWPASDTPRTQVESTHSFQYVADRGITQETMEFYDVKTKVNADGEPVERVYRYTNGAQVFRPLSGDKIFPSKGAIQEAGLWGKEKFPPGSSRTITITEGREDAMSGWQMLGTPFVSVQSAVSAARDCRVDRDYLNSFDKVVLCFDSDAPGRKAAVEVSGLFDFNKVLGVNLGGLKDANEFLTAGKADQFIRMWRGAKRFQPEDIHSTLPDFEAIIRSDDGGPGFEYPFEVLQGPTGGIRRGEVTLVTARRGVGKSTLVRQIEHKLLKSGNIVGAVHLEEPKKTLVKGLATIELGVPCHLPGSPVSDDDVWAAFKQIVPEDNRFNLYSHFGSNDPNIILDRIRYMVGVLGCSTVVLDHITMVVSGLMADDERKALDYISTRLAIMTVELNFAAVVVSHINKEGGTKGSANIADVAGTWVHLDRDVVNENQFLKRLTTVTLLKNRVMAVTGEVGKLLFHPEKHVLADLTSGDLPVT